MKSWTQGFGGVPFGFADSDAWQLGRLSRERPLRESDWSALNAVLLPTEWSIVMRTHRIAGGGGVQLHVVEAGKPGGRPVLFLHGFSQSSLAWSRQLDSDLARDHHLVAMDLRGHGLSEKPRDAYGDSRLWADDVHAVIDAVDLDGPVLSGWSYGSLVILDYVRHYGEDRIGGIHFVGGVTKLGNDAAMSVIAPGLLNLVPGFFSTDVEESVRSLESLLRLCFAQQLSASDMYLMLGYNVSVPPHVRQALFSRTIDNDDLLPRIRKPVLITHGAKDANLKPEIIDQHKAGLTHAQVDIVPNVAHAPFWEDASVFNQRLRAFVEMCGAAAMARPAMA
jgi:non-heme chloroperoxidase